jgi:ubiquinone biosynthesis protein
VPPFPSDVAVALVESELGQPIDYLFREFSREPLASASLGQVHAAVLHSGERVVVKVQRPDIASLINTDLAIINELAALAQERQIFGKQYDLVELAWEFNEALRDELDYVREGNNADRFRRNFAGNPKVHIPRVYWEYTSSRVITSERLFGVKINNLAALKSSGLNREVLARNSIHLIFQEVFQHGFFHSDPHPGNFFALPGDVIGAVDFGQVGSLDRYMTRQLLLLLMSILNHDHDGALRALQRLGMLSRYEITPALRRDAQRLIERYVGRSLSELSLRATGDALYTLSQRHGLRMPSPLALLLKTLIMMEGTGLQLDPAMDVFGIARPYAEQALVEQFMPGVIGEQVFDSARDLSEVSLMMPHQVGEALYRLNENTLLVRTHEEELHRVGGAIIGAANRVAVALVLAALLIMFGLVSISLNIGAWNQIVLIVLGAMAVGALIGLALALVFALIRGRNV